MFLLMILPHDDDTFVRVLCETFDVLDRFLPTRAGLFAQQRAGRTGKAPPFG